jgi:hypothetical protein
VTVLDTFIEKLVDTFDCKIVPIVFVKLVNAFVDTLEDTLVVAKALVVVIAFVVVEIN